MARRAILITISAVSIVVLVLAVMGVSKRGGLPIVAPPAEKWVIDNPDSDIMRAIHVAGNWGPNEEGFETLPDGYFRWLRDMNVNWVGLSVALHYDDSLDATVERVYGPSAEIRTLPDETLRRLIRRLHQHGFNVYMTLAFEAHVAERSARPVYRYQLGDPQACQVDTQISCADWPWDPSHLNHQQFVDTFWSTYTEQAVHFANIAAEEDVEMYSLGTETEGLFRTRRGTAPNDFRAEIASMIRQVRAVYNGLLTYDMHEFALTQPELAAGFWQDTNLDVIGISAYFTLTDTAPTRVMTIAELASAWRTIFQQKIMPLRQSLPKNRPIVFLEIGYSDSIAAPHNQFDEAARERHIDRDRNGRDDDEETQANIYQALFNTNKQFGNPVKGMFIWNDYVHEDGNLGFDEILGIRGKIAEDVIRQQYQRWAQAP